MGEAGRISRVAAGDAHSAFVDEYGGLFAWGCDRWMQLGQDKLWAKGAVWQREPMPVNLLRRRGVRLVDVCCGTDHTVALDDAGKVWAFGRGEHGQLFGNDRRVF